jgi:hypothetical protein
VLIFKALTVSEIRTYSFTDTRVLRFIIKQKGGQTPLSSRMGKRE